MARHLVLLGDSIFDNGAYIEPGQADVGAHLKRKCPSGWRLDMRAVDGAVADDIVGQLSSPVSKPCTFVLSVGGNDALMHLNMVTEASDLLSFYEIKEAFRDRYTQALDLILYHCQPLIVCTIYNPQFYDRGLQKLAAVGLSFFNDVITEEALRRQLPIIDLREICSEPEAFANDIEPSEVGGDLIAKAILSKITPAKIVPELPRLIIRLDDGEELIFERNQLEHRQDAYIRKKVAEIGVNLEGSPWGSSPHRIFQARNDANSKMENFDNHDKAVNWILRELSLEAFK